MMQEDNPPMIAGLEKVERDPSFRLTDDERQQMRRFFDLDALERLLAHLPPDGREEVLRCFRIPLNNQTYELWYIGDPELQEMLEEVWAPMWERRTAEEIEADDTDRPGKRLALARRRADPHPREILLAVLAAIHEERWDEAFRWIDPSATDDGASERITALRAKTASPAPRNPVILGAAEEGDDMGHIICRLRDSEPARVFTVRRTSRGWRLRYDDLLSQL
jgi:hypothetical protein